MNFQQLRIIREAARRNYNLTEVANSLFTSQSGVSRHIKDLEEELGIEIFIRRGKRLLGMTDPGKELLVIVERMLTDAGNIRRLASSYSATDSGYLRVATTHTQARFSLPGVIKEFRPLFPKVQLGVNQASPDEIVSLLLSGEVDIGIASERVNEHPDLVCFEYYRWYHSVVVPKNHPLVHEPVLTHEVLAAYPLITYYPGLTGRSRIDAAFAQAGVTADVVLSAQDADVIKTYVELDMGVGIMASMAFDPRKDTDLVQLNASHLFTPNTVWLAVRRAQYQRAYVLRFMQICNPSLSISDIKEAIWKEPQDEHVLQFDI